MMSVHSGSKRQGLGKLKRIAVKCYVRHWPNASYRRYSNPLFGCSKEGNDVSPLWLETPCIKEMELIAFKFNVQSLSGRKRRKSLFGNLVEGIDVESLWLRNAKNGILD
jgi:hypothetical protein